MIILKRLVKNGASLAINLPHELVLERGYRAGDHFHLVVRPDELALRKLDEADFEVAAAAATRGNGRRRKKR
jgi:hypothetical protein